jgi:hypothetical protein
LITHSAILIIKFCNLLRLLLLAFTESSTFLCNPDFRGNPVVLNTSPTTDVWMSFETFGVRFIRISRTTWETL